MQHLTIIIFTFLLTNLFRPLSGQTRLENNRIVDSLAAGQTGHNQLSEFSKSTIYQSQLYQAGYIFKKLLSGHKDTILDLYPNDKVWLSQNKKWVDEINNSLNYLKFGIPQDTSVLTYPYDNSDTLFLTQVTIWVDCTKQKKDLTYVYTFKSISNVSEMLEFDFNVKEDYSYQNLRKLLQNPVLPPDNY